MPLNLTGDKDVDGARCVAPHFRTGRLVVNLWVGGALELLQHKRAGRALPDLLRLPYRACHPLRAGRGPALRSCILVSGGSPSEGISYAQPLGSASPKWPRTFVLWGALAQACDTSVDGVSQTGADCRFHWSAGSAAGCMCTSGSTLGNTKPKSLNSSNLLMRVQ